MSAPPRALGERTPGGAARISSIWIQAYLGCRCNSTCSMSGYAYADGWAYGSEAVGHPVKDAVSYWYQSTASTTGMIGTSLTMTCWIWSMIDCWVAVDVVAA